MTGQRNAQSASYGRDRFEPWELDLVSPAVRLFWRAVRDELNAELLRRFCTLKRDRPPGTTPHKFVLQVLPNQRRAMGPHYYTRKIPERRSVEFAAIWRVYAASPFYLATHRHVPFT